MFIDVLNFIKENWQIILDVAAIIFSIVFCLIRKKPVKVIEDVKGVLADLIPEFINLAEAKFGSGHGTQKRLFVIDCVKKWFVENNFQYSDFYDKITRFIIENVLATPQKK